MHVFCVRYARLLTKMEYGKYYVTYYVHFFSFITARQVLFKAYNFKITGSLYVFHVVLFNDLGKNAGDLGNTGGKMRVEVGSVPSCLKML